MGNTVERSSGAWGGGAFDLVFGVVWRIGSRLDIDDVVISLFPNNHRIWQYFGNPDHLLLQSSFMELVKQQAYSVNDNLNLVYQNKDLNWLDGCFLKCSASSRHANLLLFYYYHYWQLDVRIRLFIFLIIWFVEEESFILHTRLSIVSPCMVTMWHCYYSIYCTTPQFHEWESHNLDQVPSNFLEYRNSGDDFLSFLNLGFGGRGGCGGLVLILGVSHEPQNPKSLPAY